MVLGRIYQYPLKDDILKHHLTPDYLKTTDFLVLSVKFSSNLHTCFLCVPRIVAEIAPMLETWDLARVGMKMFASKIDSHLIANGEKYMQSGTIHPISKQT